MTVKSPDADKVRFTIDDQVRHVEKLTWTQIRGDYREPEGEHGPDYGYLGQARNTRLVGFYRKFLVRKLLRVWQRHAQDTASKSLDFYGSPTTTSCPKPIGRVTLETTSSTEPQRVMSNPDDNDSRVPLAVESPSSRPHSFPRNDTKARAGMKRDSPLGGLTSPSKRSCVLLEKLKLGSPLHRRIVLANKIFSIKDNESTSSQEGSESETISELQLPSVSLPLDQKPLFQSCNERFAKPFENQKISSPFKEPDIPVRRTSPRSSLLSPSRPLHPPRISAMGPNPAHPDPMVMSPKATSKQPVPTRQKGFSPKLMAISPKLSPGEPKNQSS